MKMIEVRNPATGLKVGEVRHAEPKDVETAESKARLAQRDWAERPLAERLEILRRFHDLMIDRSDRILDVIQSESGKARRDALMEIITVAGTTRYYLSHSREHLSGRLKQPAVPAITDAQVLYKPYGLVGLISPWNYPFLLSIGDAIPALLAGNAVIVKPSELTPLSAEIALQLLREAGLKEDVLTILHGGGDVAAELIRHVDYVGFTGSTETGRKVAVSAAERLIPFSLELGGKNPMIVLEGAPLDQAVHGLIVGAFANSGQTCIGIERVYIQNSIFKSFAEQLSQQAAAMKLGWSSGWDCDMGSLISERHADKVSGHVEEARKAGAKILSGGRRRSDLGPAFVEPTVLTDVPDSVSVFSRETFGPVVALYPVRDAEEAVRLANDSEFGLNASLWSADAARAERIARLLETGSVGINSTLLIYNSFDVPMGGVKHSGIGRRHGEQGIRRYTQAQSIVSSVSAGGGYDAVLTRLDRSSRVELILKALRIWRRLPWL
jgi:succinate-semialdehyde dehydrogenase/glutarate-semialdehyde dehydrogenase